MQVIAVCVPSARLANALSRGFEKFGFNSAASSARPTHHSNRIEYFPCPIEPVDPQTLWLSIDEKTSISHFLESTLLNIEFMQMLLPQASSEDDLLTLECLMTSSSARKIMLAHAAQMSPSRLKRAAISEGSKIKRRTLAEKVLAVPCLPELLSEFADTLIAGQPRPQLP